MARRDRQVGASRTVRNRLDRIHSPTLILAFENDFIILGGQKIDCELIPNAQIEVIPNSHHWPQFGQREWFNQLALEFLTTS